MKNMAMYYELTNVLTAMIDIAECDLIDIYNQFVDAEQAEGYDMRIYHMTDFNAVMKDFSPIQIAFYVQGNENFNVVHRLFNFDIDQKLSSFEWIEDDKCNLDIEELAEYICRTLNPLGNDIIAHIITKYSKKGVC